MRGPFRGCAARRSDSSAAEQAVSYVRAGKAGLGSVPTCRRVVAERFFDEAGGMQLILHAPFGARINRAWGLALRKRFCVGFNFELQAAATDNGIVISLAEQHAFPLEAVFEFVTGEPNATAWLACAPAQPTDVQLDGHTPNFKAEAVGCSVQVDKAGAVGLHAITRINEEAPAFGPLFREGRFNNKLTLVTLFRKNPIVAETLVSGSLYAATLLSQTWRVYVQLETSVGSMLIKIPIYDANVQKMIKSCS